MIALATSTPLQWLLDTNVVSEMRRQRADPNVLNLTANTDPDCCFLSVVTLAEIQVGIDRVPPGRLRQDLESWLKDDVRSWFGERIFLADEAVLIAWRRLMIAGQKARYTWSAPDALIAATALVHGLGVVTRNTADFERAGVPLLNPWTAL